MAELATMTMSTSALFKPYWVPSSIGFLPAHPATDVATVAVTPVNDNLLLAVPSFSLGDTILQDRLLACEF